MLLKVLIDYSDSLSVLCSVCPLCCLLGQIFRIGTARYAEGLWRMHRHGPVIAHCTDSENFPLLSCCCTTLVRWCHLSMMQ